MNERHFRILGWLLPCLGMAVAAFLFMSQAARLREASTSRDRAAALLERAIANKSSLDQKAGQTTFAAVPASPAEETLFLTDLRRRVTQPGAKIVKWTSTARPAGKPEGDQEKVDPVLEDVTAVQSQLTLGGSFPSLCAFLHDLETANRLYTLSNVTWNRSHEDGTVLTCTLTRYVRPPGMVKAPQPN